MEDKYKEIYEQLKQETQNTLENKNSDKFIEEFKKAVNDRVKEIHDKLDKKKEELLDLAMKAHKKESSKEESPEELEIKKKLLEKKKKKKNNEVEIDPNSFKGKVKSLIDNLENVLLKTGSIENTIQAFKEPHLNKIVELKDNDFNFIPKRKLEFILKGKIDWDLGWDSPTLKSNTATVDKDDEKRLNVNSSSCYTYYQTDKIFSDEDILVTLASNINKTDGYLYFGVSRNDNNFASNCMCCTISQVTYTKSTGDVVERSAIKNSPKLNYGNKTGEFIIEMRILGSVQEIYFKLDDEEEQGPYKFPADCKEFRIVSGSCNSANGYIKILNSVIVG